MRRTFSSLIIATVILLSIVGGAYASWQYPSNWNFSSDIGFSFVHSMWEGSEDLPDDPTAGESHPFLVDQIVNGAGVGLNTKNSFLNSHIAQRLKNKQYETSSVAPTPGGNLVHISDEIRRLAFLLYVYTDSKGNIEKYDLYTFELALVGEKGSVVGKEVYPIYKTEVIMGEDGKWKASKTTYGTATTEYYDSKQGGGNYPTINPDSFVESSTN